LTATVARDRAVVLVDVDDDERARIAHTDRSIVIADVVAIAIANARAS
jgi:hypothetical protein